VLYNTPQEQSKRALTTRVRPTSLRQSAPQKRSLPPLRKPTTTRVGPTGPVGDAYYKKSWLRTLVVLGDQNRSQTIDRHASGLRAPGETRATHNLTTRVRRTLRQSALQKRSLPPLRKPTTTRVGPTGPVEDAYHKKSWLRTLVVLGDQNRSQPIDRHASGLRAPGETRATHNLTTRVRRTLRQSALQKRSLPPLRKPTTTRVGPTGPVEDAYDQKSWLRTLVVLDDQSRSRIT
jgi:hypothetical protein